MDQSVTLFGYLVIAFLGFVVPVLGLLFTVYQGGIEKIKIKYENMKAEAEKARRDMLAAFTSDGVHKEDFREMKKKLRELEIREKTVRRTADSRMSYLDMRKVAIGLAAPLALSMAAVLVYFVIPPVLKIEIAAFAVITFLYSVYVLIKLFDVVIEMTRLADRESKAMNARIIEALSESQEATGIKGLKAAIDGVQVSPENPLVISSGDERDLKVEILNPGKITARNTVLAVKMDPAVKVIPKQYYSIIRTADCVTVMYTVDFITPEAPGICGPLVIKINTPGMYKSETSIKTGNPAEEVKEEFSINAEHTLQEVLESIMKL